MRSLSPARQAPVLLRGLLPVLLPERSATACAFGGFALAYVDVFAKEALS